jgi:NodT family efflux transporter outer membrane factor (OMF) lipoprotein
MMHMIKLMVFLTVFTLVACSLAPTYHRPTMDTPSEYKNADQWTLANPTLVKIDRGKWWEIYGDSTLNNLQEQVTSANQDLKAAIARYDEARAMSAVAQSYLFPTVDAVATPSRLHASENVANPFIDPIYNNFLAGANLSYEIDVWGSIRNSVRAAEDQAKASAADVAFIDLSLHAELASNYFSLRGSEQAQRALDETVIAYEKALYLNRMLYQGGAAPIEVVYQAETQLETAKTLAADMHLKRGQLENAIAVLIGQPPSTFSLPIDKNYQVELIRVKPDLPSTLLERRPDIAAAELRVQAANAEIGVARAAFFPAVNLTSSIGFASDQISNLLTRPSLAWSLGPSYQGNSAAVETITQTVFDGGRIEALTDDAWAVYSETVANYRQTVLTAYQDVEDSLVALQQLEQENHTQSAASVSAYKAVAQAEYRYKGGLTTYLEVAIEQTIALQAELAAINIRTRYQLSSVQLIRALGGGW